MKKLRLLLLPLLTLSSVLSAQSESSDGGDSPAATDGSVEGRSLAVAPMNYRILPSDILALEVFQHEDLNKEFRVEADGTVNLHLIGRVNVEGLTIAEAREKITELYDRDYYVNPQIDLQILQFNLDEVQVLGQVRTPGTISIPPDEDLTLLQAIARVGGFTRLARKGSVKIRREIENGERKVFAINASDLISDPDAQDFILQDGDIVFVDERLI